MLVLVDPDYGGTGRIDGGRTFTAPDWELCSRLLTPLFVAYEY